MIEPAPADTLPVLRYPVRSRAPWLKDGKMPDFRSRELRRAAFRRQLARLTLREVVRPPVTQPADEYPRRGARIIEYSPPALVQRLVALQGARAIALLIRKSAGPTSTPSTTFSAFARFSGSLA